MVDFSAGALRLTAPDFSTGGPKMTALDFSADALRLTALDISAGALSSHFQPIQPITEQLRFTCFALIGPLSVS